MFCHRLWYVVFVSFALSSIGIASHVAFATRSVGGSAAVASEERSDDAAASQIAGGSSGLTPWYTVGGTASGIAAAGDIVYLPLGSRLHLFHQDLLGSVTEIGELFFPSLVRGIALADDIAVVITENAGVRIVDVSSPNDLMELAVVNELTCPDRYDLEIVGTRVYVAGYHCVEIIDIANPEQPLLVSHFDGPDANLGYRVAVAGDLVYFLRNDASDGLALLDVSDPASPTVVSTYANGNLIRDVAVRDHYVFLTEPGTGIRVLDASDPTHLVEVTTYADSGNIARVEEEDGILYATASDGIRLVDVNAPANPQEIGGFDVDEFVGTLYVYGDRVAATIGGDGFIVLDVASPDNIVERSRYMENFGAANAVAMMNGYAYVGAGGLRVLDATQFASKPEVIGGFDLLTTVNDIVVDNGVAFLSVRFDGLHILDVSDPRQPVALNVVANPYIWYLDYESDHLYFTEPSGSLRILDVTNPGEPLEVGQHWAESGSTLGQVDVEGEVAHVTLTTRTPWVTRHGLLLVDVSDPEHTVEVGFFETPNELSDVSLAGSMAVITGSDGIRLVDVSDPAQPELIALWDGSTGSYGALTISGSVLTVGTYAYTGWTYRWAIWQLDITDPANPTPIGYTPVPSSVQQISMKGDTALVANGTNGLTILGATPIPPTPLFLPFVSVLD